MVANAPQVETCKWIPTKEELEELGFNNEGYIDGSEWWRSTYAFPSFKIFYLPESNKFSLYGKNSIGDRFYPRSLSDLKTLIEILTHNN